MTKNGFKDRGISYVDNFFSKVDANGCCWEWNGARDRRNYGVSSRPEGRGAGRAHRISYEILVGPIPAGLVLDHLCRNPPCVNPDHLEPVTNHENLKRGFGFVGLNIRKEKCPAGHVLDRESKGRGGRPMRYCSACKGVGPQRPTLDEGQISELRRMHQDEGISYTELGRRFGIGNDAAKSVALGLRGTAFLRPAVDQRAVRDWAEVAGYKIGATGVIAREILDAYQRSHAA